MWIAKVWDQLNENIEQFFRAVWLIMFHVQGASSYWLYKSDNGKPILRIVSLGAPYDTIRGYVYTHFTYMPIVAIKQRSLPQI